MDEILALLKDNNRMLKKICDYVDKVDSAEYQNQEDIKNMAINLLANTMLDYRK